MNKKMPFITLKQFIYAINIRDCYYSDDGKEIDSNKIIRIYYDYDMKKEGYIDLGWYDYYDKDKIWDILKTMLNKNILEGYVTDFFYDEDKSVLTIYVENKGE